MIPARLAASSAGSGFPPQLLVFVVVLVVWIFKAIQRAVAGPSAPARPGSRAGPELSDDERERRVREEVLRKVTERQLGRRAASGTPRAAATASAPGRMAPAFASAAAQPPALAARPGVAAPALEPPRGSHWLDDLRTRDGVRGAVLAREIMGAPLALRPWRYSPLGE
jgi:hypothetical protein